jgi:hypothetical protein
VRPVFVSRPHSAAQHSEAFCPSVLRRTLASFMCARCALSKGPSLPQPPPMDDQPALYRRCNAHHKHLCFTCSPQRSSAGSAPNAVREASALAISGGDLGLHHYDPPRLKPSSPAPSHAQAARVSRNQPPASVKGTPEIASSGPRIPAVPSDWRLQWQDGVVPSALVASFIPSFQVAVPKRTGKTPHRARPVRDVGAP